VLETKGASNFSVSMETNPYRLVVEIRKIGAPPQRTKIDLFGPIEQSPTETATVGAAPSVPRLRIVLDAGHGGWDLGTVGREGLLEKDLALDIVRRLGKLAENRLGAEVIYTRKDDDYVPLEKRAEIANVAKADLFMSVHANYSGSTTARGVETYYTNTYSSMKARSAEDEADPALRNIDWTHVDIREKVRGSHRFAAEVQRALYATLAAKNPGLPNRGVKAAQYVVLTGTTMPAILAEVSFVSSPTDEDNLRNAAYRQQIADALYQGISRYAQESGRLKLASASLKTVAR
jgi:N-acetylmuramoyl-L-alanine amidase